MSSGTLSIVLPYWFDRPDLEALEIAGRADRLGFPRLWIGEMATFDAFALAGALARETSSIELVVGPVAAGVRSPAALALGLHSVVSLGERRAHLALGASSPEIVAGWHGARWETPLQRLRETWEATGQLLAGARLTHEGRQVGSSGFRLRGPVETEPIAVAVFGPGTLRWGARTAERVVLNLLTPDATRRMVDDLHRLAAAAGREPPAISLWLPAALDPGEGTRRQVAAQLAAYLAAPGYRELFAEAGAASLVERAAGGEPRSVLAAEFTDEVLAAFVAWGDRPRLRTLLEELFDLGIDEIAVVPCTADDPGGQRLLEALADLRVEGGGDA